MEQTSADRNTNADSATDEQATALDQVRTQMKEVTDSMTELADGFGSYETTTKQLEEVTADQVGQIQSSTESDGSQYIASGD